MFWPGHMLHPGHIPCPILRGSNNNAQFGRPGMPVSRLKFESLPPAIFLQRVSGPQAATTLEARLGQGAFLALRLVDLLARDRSAVSGDAFHYQWIATHRFCRELRATATEGAHVHGIAASASDAYRLGQVPEGVPAPFADAHSLRD